MRDGDDAAAVPSPRQAIRRPSRRVDGGRPRYGVERIASEDHGFDVGSRKHPGQLAREPGVRADPPHGPFREHVAHPGQEGGVERRYQQRSPPPAGQPLRIRGVEARGQDQIRPGGSVAERLSRRPWVGVDVDRIEAVVVADLPRQRVDLVVVAFEARRPHPYGVQAHALARLAGLDVACAAVPPAPELRPRPLRQQPRCLPGMGFEDGPALPPLLGGVRSGC